jgi:hypothetical protein
MHFYLPFIAALSTLVLAQIPLKSFSTFAIIASQSITSTGGTAITGNVALGNTRIYITGLTSTQVSGIIYASDDYNDIARIALQDAQAAYDAAKGLTPTVERGSYGDELGGQTLRTGVYAFGSSVGITGDLYLDARGNSGAQFISKIGTTLTTAEDSRVILINSAQACNVFWQVGTSATLGEGSILIGRVLAATTVTFGEGVLYRGVWWLWVEVLL